MIWARLFSHLLIFFLFFFSYECVILVVRTKTNPSFFNKCEKSLAQMMLCLVAGIDFKYTF